MKKQYIVCEENKEAYEMAMDVVSRKINNGLITLCGIGAIGKTQLLSIIYDLLKDKINIIMIDSAAFIKDAIGLDTGINSFDKYNEAEILIIDNIDILELAPKITMKLIDLILKLITNNKLIILSIGRKLSNLNADNDFIKLLEKHKMINMYLPNYQARLEIVEKLISGNEIIFTEEVKQYIVDKSYDIRQLEGMIYKLIAFASVYNLSRLSIKNVESVLKSI